MAVRIREDRSIVCAAMHEARADDLAYIDDGLHYRLSVLYGVLVTDEQHLALPGREGHGLWWWCDEVPEGREPSSCYAEARAHLIERRLAGALAALRLEGGGE